MKQEIGNFKPAVEVESDFEAREFSPEQKKVLGDTWFQMIVDDLEVPANISAMGEVEIRQWLYSSMMGDIAKLADEFGLKIDTELIERINKAENLEAKAALELEYIKQAHAQVDGLTKNFVRSADKSTKWDSWPKRMRETREFNCVGATLLGTNFLESAGVESYYGSPSGHAVNIVKLSNGEWWYVDFRNGKNSVLKIEPKLTQINDVTVLEINNPDIDYKLIPIYPNSEIVGSVFGNLTALKEDASDPDILDEDIEKIEAKAYLQKYGQNFAVIDFSFVEKILYPQSARFHKTSEMQAERVRIESLRDFYKPAQEYTRTLEREKILEIRVEISQNQQAIADLFYKDDQTVLASVSIELKNILQLLLDNLQTCKARQSEIYQEAIDGIVAKIKGI